MKKQYDTRGQPSLHDLTFFTDRDLGKVVPRILREHGLKVELYFDHFAEGEHVEDNRWLSFAFQRGWIAVSHDDNIRRDSEAIRTVMENKGRLFILRGAVGGIHLAAIFLEASAGILRMSLDESLALGFISNIRRSASSGGAIKSAAHLMLTYDGWKAGQRQTD